jgi:hypothetical protein
MNSNQYKDSLMLLEIYVLAIGLPILHVNNEIFIETTIIHSLQGFYIHYGMYVVAKRLRTLFLFFFYFIGFFYSKLRL